MKKVVLLILAITSFQLNGQNFSGDWHGVLSVQGTELRVVFHISADNGDFSSTMDSPDQGALGIPMDETKVFNQELEIRANALNASYLGQISEEGDRIIGTFSQGGMSLDLILTKEAKEPETVNRPQEPETFPYFVEELTFVNPVGGHHLAGTLTMPADGEFNKVVVLISGSGPQDRNEEVFNHKPFLVLSDYLTRQGLAVLRYDDRGVGESEGDFASATTKDFANDVAAAVSYLKNRKEMKGKEIGLAGHSEGGLVAPMVAADNKNVDFIVLLAGPGIKSTELLLLQQDKIGEAVGIPVDFRKTQDKMARELFEYMETNRDAEKEAMISGLKLLLANNYDTMPVEMQEMVGDKELFINQQIRASSSDWYQYFIGMDPDQYLSMVKVPVLAVNGELDLQVPPKENLQGIQRSLERAGNSNVTTHECKGLNHLFQKAETGAPSEYVNLDETFNTEAMEFISNWIHTL
jgi:pimeloyl-ACP methyl ester carboxylesterase